MPLSDKNILIVPATNTTDQPILRFTAGTASTVNTITFKVLDSGPISIEGNAGQLMSIIDSNTGTLFSVNDISGVPSIEVLDTGLIKLAHYNGAVTVGFGTTSTSTTTGALVVNGGVGVGGNLNVGGSINIPISSANLVLGSSFVNAGSPQIVLGRGTTGDTNLISGNAGVFYGGVSTGIRILANGSGAIDLATYNGNWGVTGYGIGLRVTSDRTVQTFGTDQATSTTTGALQVIGGVGIGGNLYVGGLVQPGTGILERATVSATAATGTINYDVLTQSVLYYTTNASGNWTLNIRGNSGTTLNNLMAIGQSITVAFLVTNGGTAYYQTAFQIDGSSVTAKWQGGNAPTSGSTSSVDIYVVTIVKTGASTYTAFESQTKFA